LVGEEEGYEGTAEKQAEVQAEQASRAVRAAATATTQSLSELRGFTGGDERRSVRDLFLQVKNNRGVFMNTAPS
jgi:hypothetical protein